MRSEKARRAKKSKKFFLFLCHSCPFCFCVRPKRSNARERLRGCLTGQPVAGARGADRKSAGVQHVALRPLETMKIDRIYKIYRIRMKKINPVNLVNPVYFLKSLHAGRGALKE